MPIRTIGIMLLTCALVGWVAMAPGVAARQPSDATGPTAVVQPPEFPAVSPSVVASLESAAPPQILADGGRAGDSIYQPAPNVHIALGRPAAEQAQIAATGAGGAPSSTTNMSYHGGPTQQTVAAYTIFWSPHGTISSSYRTLINRYFQDIGGSSFYNVVSQYPGLTDTQNVSTLGGTWIDTNPYPAGEGTASNPLSHTDIKTEVARALSLNPGWNPAGLGRTYFVYTEPGIENCWDPTVTYANLSCSPGVASPNGVLCAYHSAFGTLNNPVIYANMPYGDTWPGVCRGFGTSPNGDVAADGEISMSSHEQFEAVTDPLFAAWFDSDSTGEIGDKCAYKYGSIMPDGHNLVLNGHPYILQLEWSNADNDGVTPFSGCVNSYAPTSTPTATPTATTDVWGDLNCNHHVDAGDADSGLRTLAGASHAAPAAACLAPLDVNCSGQFNALDVLAILKYLVNLVTSVPGCPAIGGPASTPTPTPHATPTQSGSPTSSPTPTPHTSTPTPSPTVAPASISLRKTTAYYDNLGALWVVGEAFNGSSHAVSLVKVTANYYSASNSLLATQDGYACLKTIAGGVESPYSVLLLNPPLGIDHYTYQVTGFFDPAPFPLPLGLQTSITNRYLDGSGIWHTVGTIKNNSATTTFSSVRACGAYYNASGDVIRTHGPNTSPSTLAPGQSGSFDVIAIGVAAEATNVEVIADADQ